MNVGDFQELLQDKGHELYRDMPWREDARPYYVLVSELMLQQTQVDRVIPKFKTFVRHFPNEESLANASLGEVLTLWSGLGYNRRAKFLHESVKKIVREYNGGFPDTKEKLMSLPGIGPGTAGAILVYAFSQPAIFIETNVRTVYFHHFFEDGEKIHDNELIPLIKMTLDNEHPREFYWALMDYGTWLKRNGAGRVALSHHYKKQSSLKGSIREVRGQIIALLTHADLTIGELQEKVIADQRFDPAFAGLLADGLISHTGTHIHLTK